MGTPSSQRTVWSASAAPRERRAVTTIPGSVSASPESRGPCATNAKQTTTTLTADTAACPVTAQQPANMASATKKQASVSVRRVYTVKNASTARQASGILEQTDASPVPAMLIMLWEEDATKKLDNVSVFQVS